MTNKTCLYFLAKRNDEGFVLVAALMVIFLVLAIVGTVAAVTSSDLKSSARARAIIKTRFVAESVSDSIFATIALEKNGYTTTANKLFTTNPPPPSPDDTHNPLNASPNFGSVWFRITDNGDIKQCDDPAPDAKNICFVARMRSSTGALAREQVTLDVIARGGCRLEGVNYKNCIYRNYQQVMRTRSYVDYVQISDMEDGDVGAIKNVAYVPSDVIPDQVVSNDALGITYCGNVTNVADLQAVGGASPTDSFCTDPAPSVGFLPYPKFLPGQVDRSGQNVKNETSSTSVFASLAGGSSVNSPYYVDTTLPYATIVLTPTNVVINGMNKPYPSNGVIYVNGDAKVSGKFSKGISIYATNDVTIGSAGIQYDSGTDTFPGSISLVSGIPEDDIVGIAAGNDIILDCGSGPVCPDVNVVAVLDAPNGRVYNPRWATASIPASGAKRFTLYGAIIAKNHPVFGSYYSTSPNSKIEHGWAKTLNYDGRLALQQPPYFFRTTQANVVRGTLDESPCDSSYKYGASGPPICTS